MKLRVSWRLLLVLSAAIAVIAVACGDGDEEAAATEAAAAAEPDYLAAFNNEILDAARSEPAGAPAAEATISVQLDWLPNTNHTGVYVALASGWYAEEGLQVEVLPYTGANGDVLVANGVVDVAFSFPTSVPFSRRAGLDVVSIAAVLQHNPTEVAVLADSAILRPRDLDGKLYAGFGLPYEIPQLRAVIRADGGEGNIRNVILATSAYEALYAGEADVTETFVTWEGIEARQRGVELRTFPYSDFGIPDFPGVVIVSSSETVAKERDGLVRFLRATIRGYEFAASNPQEAAQLMIDYVGEDVFPNLDLVFQSAELLASDYYLDNEGEWGTQTAQQWSDYPKWLFDQGLLEESD